MRALFHGLSILFMALLLPALQSCNKSSSPTEPATPPPSSGGGIGAQGGTVSSPDSMITVVIPAGALASPVNISIASSSDTMSSGIGRVFKLLPEGTTFQHPVVLKIHYADSLVPAFGPYAFGVAYRSSSGQWMAVGGGNVDTTGKIVSVPIMHFSGWSMFEAYQISPGDAIMFVGSSLTVSAYRLGQGVLDTVGGVPIPVLPTRILPDAWLANGILTGNLNVGTIDLLLNGSGSYHAPQRMPGNNPVAIDPRIFLPNLSELYLRCNVTVLARNWRLTCGRGFGYQCSGFLLHFDYTDSTFIDFSLTDDFHVAPEWQPQGGNSLLTDVGGCQAGYGANVNLGNQTSLDAIDGSYNHQSRVLALNVTYTPADLPGFDLYQYGTLVVHQDISQVGQATSPLPVPLGRTFSYFSSTRSQGLPTYIETFWEVDAQ